MLPKKIHIAAIERYHKVRKEQYQKIDKLKEEGDIDGAYEFLKKWMILDTELWPIIDYFTEFVIDHNINLLLDEEEHNWPRLNPRAGWLTDLDRVERILKDTCGEADQLELGAKIYEKLTGKQIDQNKLKPS